MPNRSTYNNQRLGKIYSKVFLRMYDIIDHFFLFILVKISRFWNLIFNFSIFKKKNNSWGQNRVYVGSRSARLAINSIFLQMTMPLNLMNVVALKRNEPNKVALFARQPVRKKAISNFEPLFQHCRVTFYQLGSL